jgi:hypothetical protein
VEILKPLPFPPQYREGRRAEQTMPDEAEQRIRKTGGIGHEDLWNMVESEFANV